MKAETPEIIETPPAQAIVAYAIPCLTPDCLTMIKGAFAGDFGSATCPVCGAVFMVKIYSKPAAYAPIERDDVRMLDNAVRAIDEYMERQQE